MKALILRNDAEAAVATARTLIDQGFHIMSVDTLDVAKAIARIDAIDLIVMDERVEGQLTHVVGLSGERKNPYLSTILVTDRTAQETDDLFELMPSLYGIIGENTSTKIIGQLAMSAQDAIDEKAARVAQYQADELAEEREVENSSALVLETSHLVPLEDDTEGGAPCYADIAIAAPELAELAQSVPEPSIARVNDAVMAEVAALFQSYKLPPTGSTVPTPAQTV